VTDTVSSSRLRHVAISIGTLGDQPQSEVLLTIKNSAKICFKLGIPMVTFQLHSGAVTPEDTHFWTHLCDDLARWDFLHSANVKASVLGKWYGLSDDMVEKVKQLLKATKDYDGLFLNLCMNYSGQEEIVDACRIAALQVQQGRLDVESISAAVIKENLASSAVLPPDILIIVGNVLSLHELLLWDSGQARIVFVQKKWTEFTKEDLTNALAA